MSAYWSDKDKELVLDLWKKGKSAAQIAQALGQGRTRNSVSGLLNRMNLKRDKPKARTTPIKRTPRPKVIRIRAKDEPPKPKENYYTPIEEVPPPEGGVPFYETRRTQCKYVLNTNSNAHLIKCCGGPVYRESSWCRHHYHEVFTSHIDREKPVFHQSSGRIQAATKLHFRRM